MYQKRTSCRFNKHSIFGAQGTKVTLCTLRAINIIIPQYICGPAWRYTNQKDTFWFVKMD